jgi:hypothetical protein
VSTGPAKVSGECLVKLNNDFLVAVPVQGAGLMALGFLLAIFLLRGRRGSR